MWISITWLQYVAIQLGVCFLNWCLQGFWTFWFRLAYALVEFFPLCIWLLRWVNCCNVIRFPKWCWWDDLDGIISRIIWLLFDFFFIVYTDLFNACALREGLYYLLIDLGLFDVGRKLRIRILHATFFILILRSSVWNQNFPAVSSVLRREKFLSISFLISFWMSFSLHFLFFSWSDFIFFLLPYSHTATDHLLAAANVVGTREGTIWTVGYK